MKIINTIKLTLLTLATITGLTGCGGGGGASFESSIGTIVASCTGNISTWTRVNRGDVVSATSGTQLKFDHDSSGVKKVCVVVTFPTGSATIQ
jgi:hypothetical protein